MTEDVKRTPANDNPYYRMMTLYGEHDWKGINEKLHARNRLAWNRWMAEWLTDEQRADLREKGFSEEELTPFDDVEREELLKAYRKRSNNDTEELPDKSVRWSNFCDIQFQQDLYAQKLIFTDWVIFKNAYFDNTANFEGAFFINKVDFDNAFFAETANFQHTSFTKESKFKNASFSKTADFESTSFAEEADFEGVSFSRDAYFEHASFAKGVHFNGASFANWANFENTSFTMSAIFKGARFDRSAYFQRTSFTGRVDFQNATFNATLSLNNATFDTIPPQFFDADLKQATFFHNITWPDPPKDKDAAIRHADAYQRLRLFMDEQKRTRDELDFFILEMKCRRRSFKLSEKIVSYLFQLTADFGRSWQRPLVGMLLTVLACLFFYYAALPDVGYMTTNSQCLAPSPTAACPADTLRFTSETSVLKRVQIAFSLSAANTFRVFGGGFVFADEIKSLSFGLRTLGLFQSFFGTVFLGLLGLGLRNRFRLH